MENFSDIINVCTVTLEQFNASLMDYHQKNILKAGIHFNYFDSDPHRKHSIITCTSEGEFCSEADENTLRRSCGVCASAVKKMMLKSSL